MSECLEIRTLGGLTVLRDGTPIRFPQRKAPALLVYLASTGRACPREVLAEMFWEERSQRQALSNLRVALSDLRSKIRPYLDDTTPETVGLNLDNAIQLDTHDFEAQLASAGHDLARLETALELYRGEFLEGFYVESADFEDWIRLERERLRLRAMEGLDRLAAGYLGANRPDRAMACVTRLLHLDPLRVESRELLIRVYIHSGQVRKAIDEYNKLSQWLGERGDSPNPELTRLITQPTILAPVRAPEAAVQPVRTRSAILVQAIHDIPWRSNPLMGRETLLHEINTLLAQHQRVLLQGFGGVGKTVLAAEALAQWIGSGQQPALWLEMGSESTSTLLEALARPFGAQQSVAAAQDERRFPIVRGLLDDQGVQLVVLDNAWDARVLNQVLSAIPPGVPVLITSRQRYPVGKILAVDALEMSHALELLSHHAFQIFTPADLDACDLCRRVGCHPFALEIAGKTLQVDDLTPGDLLARFGDAPHLMVVPGWSVEEGRESAKDLIDASLDALSPAELETFLAFGALFVPAATLDLIALCLDRDPAAVEEDLATLHRRGLAERRRTVDHGPISFTVHDLTYSYARANARLPLCEVLNACRDYIRAYPHNLDALDAEIGNLLEAACAAHEAGEQGTLVEIMRLLAVEAGYFVARGYNTQILDLMWAAIEMSKATDQIEAAHYLLGKYGDAQSIYLGNFAPALAAYDEALKLARMMGNPHRTTILLTLMGTTRYRTDQSDPGPDYDEAYTLAVAHDDDQGRAFVLTHRCFTEGQRNPQNFERLLCWCDEAVEIAARLGQHETHFMALINRANCERSLGRLGQALASDQEAYALAGRHDNRRWLAEALFSLGEDYHALGERDQAQHHLNQAVELFAAYGVKDRLDRVLSFMRSHSYEVPSG